MIFLFKIKNTNTNKEKTMKGEMNQKKKKKQHLWNEFQTQRCYLQNLNQFCLRETSEHSTCDQV